MNNRIYIKIIPKNIIFNISYKFPDDIVINILDFLNQIGPYILVYDHKQKKFISKEHPIYKEDKVLVQKNGMCLQYVQYQFQTEEMCKLAVQQDGISLKFVPK